MKVYVVLCSRVDPYERGEDGCRVIVEGVYDLLSDAEAAKDIGEAEVLEKHDGVKDESNGWTYYKIVEEEVQY